jgi:hypothetical protein
MKILSFVSSWRSKVCYFVLFAPSWRHKTVFLRVLRAFVANEGSVLRVFVAKQGLLLRALRAFVAT